MAVTHKPIVTIVFKYSESTGMLKSSTRQQMPLESYECMCMCMQCCMMRHEQVHV